MNSFHKYSKKFFFLFILITTLSFSQSDIYSQKVIGQPFIKTYTQKDYKAGRSNWCVVQDKRGVVYVGNENGIVEFDGSSWRKINVPNSESVRTMDIDENGTIFVCAAADFGYLESNSKGLLEFKSLLPYLDEKNRNFGEMWDVITSSHGVYYKNDDRVFRWKGDSIKVWDSIYAFRLYNINDTIYSRNQGTGLMVIDGDSIKLMPDGEFFNDTGVYNMLPFVEKNNREKILITTNSDGLFLHFGGKNYPFKTEVDAYLSENQVYNACFTSDGNIALSTQRGGVIIIDKSGKLLRIINKNNGLPTDVVFDVWPEPAGGLWLATLNGIVHCEIPSSFSTLNKSGLLEDQANSIIRFKQKLYITNELGIFSYSPKDAFFNLLNGSDLPATTLIDANGTLLAATNGEIAVIKGDRIGATIDEYANVLYYSKVFPNRIYAGNDDGFSVILKEENEKFVVTYSKEFDAGANEFVEDKDGGLWIGGYFRGIYHVTGNLSELSSGSDENIKYEYFSVKDDLPGLNLGIYNVQDKILLSTNEGVFHFNKESNSFYRDSTLGNIFFDSTRTISLIKNDKNNEMWIVTDSSGQYDLGKATLQNDGKYNWKSIPEFRRLNLNAVSLVYPEFDSEIQQEVMWICSDESLIFYSPNSQKDINANFSVLIRKVNINNDSLIYGGAGYLDTSAITHVLQYSENNIEFEFSATSYDKPGSNKFQYLLKGNDEAWSPWSEVTKKEYTNLSNGDYSFRVRAKNVYGKISSTDVFYFKVLPPWYLTWWSFLLYAFALISGIFITDRFMRGKIIRREREKAKLVEAEYRAEAAELQAKAAEAQSRVIQAENERKTKELEEARQLQLSMLPKVLPQLPQLDIAVYMKTATEVGGDYYDFVLSKGGTLNVAIGDGTGHGMQAGTLVTIIKGLFTSEANNKEIIKFFNDSSRTIKEINLGRLMMAFSLLKINENRIQFSSAGMPPMYIYRKKEKIVEEVNMQGMPLGAIKNFNYKLFETDLSSGDCILLLSDGYPELSNPDNEQIGYDRLQAQFENVAEKNPEDIVEYLKKKGSEWANDKVPDDDVTFVVIKVK